MAPRVTHRHVAERAGVSTTTVSFVLNDRRDAHISAETRQRVLVAADELGYVPSAAAQALARGRTETIGLIFSRTDVRPSIAEAELMEGVLVAARRHGVRLLVDAVEDTDDRDPYWSLARAKRIDGIIVATPNIHDPGLQAIADTHLPTVVLGNLPHLPLSSVEFDNVGGARAAVNHLLSLGHTRIACITRDPATRSGVQERVQGYREALSAAGLPFDPQRVRQAVGTPYAAMARRCTNPTSRSTVSATSS